MLKIANPNDQYHYMVFNFSIWVLMSLSTLCAEETSRYSWSRHCTANYLPLVCKYQLYQKRVRGLNWRPQRWEESVLPLRYCGPLIFGKLFSNLYDKHFSGRNVFGQGKNHGIDNNLFNFNREKIIILK